MNLFCKETKITVLLLIGLFVNGASSQVVGRNDIAVQDLTLFVEGEEYWVKGIAYEPVPLGRIDMTGSQEGGSGLCSPRQTPFGDIANPAPEFKSACYDSDYFCGTVMEGGPPEGWFVGLWERDFPKMKELGVNTIRVYNANPTTLQASIDQLGTGDIAYPLGKNHLPFMDMAEEYGFKVIFPLMGDLTIMLNTEREQYEQYLRNQIDEVGNHSALLMYTLGNELGLITGEDDGWSEAEGIADNVLDLLIRNMNYAKQYQEEKWGRFVPMTTAVVDYPISYVRLALRLPVDVFTTNAGYRGDGFSNLWTGTGPEFPGWLALSCIFDMPVLIGEWGWESEDNAQTLIQPDWLNRKYSELVKNNVNGCIGGVFFEYNDEPYKASVDQQTMGVVKFSPSECSFTQDCWVPDLVEEKEIVYDAMASGSLDTTDDGIDNPLPWNYNADVWALLGRPRRTLAESVMPEVCAPFEGISSPTQVTSSQSTQTSPVGPTGTSPVFPPSPTTITPNGTEEPTDEEDEDASTEIQPPFVPLPYSSASSTNAFLVGIVGLIATAAFL